MNFPDIFYIKTEQIRFRDGISNFNQLPEDNKENDAITIGEDLYIYRTSKLLNNGGSFRITGLTYNTNPFDDTIDGGV